MKTTRTIKATGKALTLADLRSLMASLDGADSSTPVKARVTMGGWLREVTIEADNECEASGGATR